MVFRNLVRKSRLWIESKISETEFQSRMARIPIARFFAKRDAEKIYDLVAGFVYSQILFSLVSLGVLHQLRGCSKSSIELSELNKINEKNMKILCNAAVSLDLLRLDDDCRYSLGRLGAEILGVPGLEDMIIHHEVFYRDLAEPIALLRSKRKTELSKYWPYVLSDKKRKQTLTEDAKIYSALMASSQMLVSQETLRLVNFGRFGTIMDVGGGTGTFLSMLGKKFQKPKLILFDLPEVVKNAPKILSKDLLSRTEIVGGNFDKNELPKSASAITLNRVLYDHDDHKVELILKKVWNALPKGGSLIISEPMAGGQRPIKSGDAYFGFYTMAMTTGQPRSVETHRNFLRKTGFREIRVPRGARNYVTKVVVAQK